MTPNERNAAHRSAPTIAKWLGYGGLLPQLTVVVLLMLHDLYWRFAALSLGYAYAALILSFVGGMWWGIASRQQGPAPGWLWVAATVPSLVALGSAIPWAVGAPWPGPSLIILAIALIGSLAIDSRIVSLDLTPVWWMSVRTPLSLGLGLLTLAASLM
jgi:hypothetical protein